jgi:hypothetical protein
MKYLNDDRLTTKYDKNNNVRYSVQVTHGLTVEVRDYIYEEIVNDKWINDNFNLNVTRLNRWWYKVNFE